MASISIKKSNVGDSLNVMSCLFDALYRSGIVGNETSPPLLPLFSHLSTQKLTCTLYELCSQLLPGITLSLVTERPLGNARCNKPRKSKYLRNIIAITSKPRRVISDSRRLAYVEAIRLDTKQL